jgi:SSS family solute:Na+ symporter
MPGIEMHGTALIIAMVVIYMAITSWLTFYFRAKTSSDFMVAARSVPALIIGVLMMSEFIAPKSTIGVAQVAFESGMAAGWAVLSVALGFPLFGWVLAKKLYASGEYTISAAIAKKYGRSTQLTVSLIMIYALLLVNVAFYVSGAAALSSAFHMSLTTASILIATVSTFYCIIGGQKSAAYVSVLHTGVKCLGIAIILGVALHLTGGVKPMMDALPAYYFTWDGKIGLTTIIAWTVASIGSIFSTQYIMQAISSLKGPQDVRAACYTAGIICLPVSIALGLIGVSARFLFPGMKSLYALPVFLNHMSPALSGLVMVSIVASILVGVSSVALATSALIVRDFYVPAFRPAPASELRMSRLLTIPIGFLPLLFVFFVPQVLHLSFFTRALRLSISVVAIFAFYAPRFGSNRGATLGLVGSTVTTTAWYIMGDPYGIDDIYVALVTPGLVMLVESLVARLTVKDVPVEQAAPDVRQGMPHSQIGNFDKSVG